LNSFHVPGGPALDTDGTVNILTNQHNDEQPSPPLSPPLVPPPPLVHLATSPPTYTTPCPVSPPKRLTRA
jgi:hypothetical protein